MTAINKEMFTFSSAALPDSTFYVARFEGTEALNTLFNFELLLLCNDANIDTGALIGTSAVFTIHRNDGEDAVFHGYISEISESGSIRGFSYYTVKLQPFFGKFKLAVNSAVFLDCDLKQTIEKVMAHEAFLGVGHEFRFTGEYPKKEFGMQYKENSFDYILWRLVEQGAYFYFDKKGERIIFADDPKCHDEPAGKVYYSPLTGLENSVSDEVITSFTVDQALLPRRVIVRTYDWKEPNTMLAGIAEVSKEGTGDVYLSNEEAGSQGEAERIAKIRAEQILAASRIFKGSGYVPFLRPGVVFTLVKHYSEKFNRNYIVTKVKHEGQQQTLLNMVLQIPIDCEAEQFFYRNTFECIDSDTKYLSTGKCNRAVIPGSITAFIDGDKAGEPLMDKYGRYRILFPFDISGRSDGKASCWIRRAQEQVGKDFGAAFPLVPGTEVLISFLCGNPDQPVITGSLANGESGSISGGGNSQLSGFRSEGGAQLMFNNENVGIGLTDLAGGEISMGSGSMGYLRKNTHIGLKTTASSTSNLGGFLADNLTGFVYRRRAICTSLSQYLSVAATAAAKTGQKIYDGLCEKSADPHQSQSDFGAMITKMIPLIAFLETPPYNIKISASKKNASARMQCYPSTKEICANILIMVIARVASMATDFADGGVNPCEAELEESTLDLSQYIDALKKGMQAVYDTGVINEFEKYNGKAKNAFQQDIKVGDYFEAAVKSPCGYYEQVKKAMEDSIRTLEVNLEDASSEENRIAWTNSLSTLESLSTNLKNAYQEGCEKLEKNHKDANAKLKKNIWRNKIVGQLVSLLPEAAVIAAIYIWRNRAKTQHIGGIKIEAKDKNMNLHAKTYIGLHAERGIYFNTDYMGKIPRELERQAWGAPGHEFTETNIEGDADETIYNIFKKINDREITFKGKPVPDKPDLTDPLAILPGEEDVTIEKYIKRGHINIKAKGLGAGSLDYTYGEKQKSTKNLAKTIINPLHIFDEGNDTVNKELRRTAMKAIRRSHSNDRFIAGKTKLYYMLNTSSFQIADQGKFFISPEFKIFRDYGTFITRSNSEEGGIIMKSLKEINFSASYGKESEKNGYESFLTLNSDNTENTSFECGLKDFGEGKVNRLIGTKDDVKLINENGKSELLLSKDKAELGYIDGVNSHLTVEKSIIQLDAKKIFIGDVLVSENNFKGSKTGMLILGPNKEMKLTEMDNVEIPKVEKIEEEEEDEDNINNDKDESEELINTDKNLNSSNHLPGPNDLTPPGEE